ncbi:prolyl oligopeptidase family serine peptidase [Botrimarina sp.]|uniref:alpha/beta hydrolase family protein n=1 Tax=Botrimarina sp. TaxID=2795802 RepID=UPI0032EC4D0D
MPPDLLRRSLRLAIGALATLPAIEAAGQRCSTGCELYSYASSVSADAGGPLDLRAFAFYPRDLAPGADAPIAVVMHGYSPRSTFGDTRQHAERLAGEGFVAVLVAMRGRDGSDGQRDSGGLEIYDIYDAVEHLKADDYFAPRVDRTNVHITGFSGGGGNVMSALTKFPDYFRLGSSYYGISDYGFDPVTGWYVNGADVGVMRTDQLDTDVGDPTTGDPGVLDRYLARASNLASKNNPYSEIHLFVNSDETISPPVNHASYRDNAVAAASSPGEFDNITVHVGQSDGSLWVDHNGDGVRDDDELQNFPHSGGLESQARGEAWYLDRLRAGLIPEPVLAPADELFVAGWVRTKPFELFIGDGQDAAARLEYELDDRAMAFQMLIESSDKSPAARLTVDPSLLATPWMLVELNGEAIATALADEPFVYASLRHGDTLRLVAIPEPSGAAATSIAAASCAAATAGRRRGRPLVTLGRALRLARHTRCEPHAVAVRGWRCD